MSTLQHFEEEYRVHIEEHRCPAGKCRALITYSIVPENCTGCTLCARNCPSGAISGEKQQLHVIDPNLCIRCGLCKEVCNFDAVIVE